MLLKKCLTCGKEFWIRPNRKDIAKYCSNECFQKSRKINLISVKCKQCGKEFQTRCYIFCSHKCYSNWKFNKNYPERHPRWKGGKYINKDGYIYLRREGHPNSNRDHYVLRSRLVAEKELKRYLTKKEIIHHINENKSDDRPENLYLFPSNSAHTSYHHLKNKLKSNLSQNSITTITP